MLIIVRLVLIAHLLGDAQQVDRERYRLVLPVELLTLMIMAMVMMMMMTLIDVIHIMYALKNLHPEPTTNIKNKINKKEKCVNYFTHDMIEHVKCIHRHVCRLSDHDYLPVCL